MRPHTYDSAIDSTLTAQVIRRRVGPVLVLPARAGGGWRDGRVWLAMGAATVIPLTVKEAPQGSTWGPEVLQLPGLELLRASLERRLPEPPVTKLTGLRLSEVGLAMASAWM